MWPVKIVGSYFFQIDIDKNVTVNGLLFDYLMPEMKASKPSDT